MWGKDTFETQRIIRKDHGDDEIQCLAIGVAGENLVKFANVMSGLKNSAGRTGMGAVMGSKGLKAIAAKGTIRVEFAYPKELFKYCKKMNEAIMATKWAKAQSRWGSPIIFSNTNLHRISENQKFSVELA